MHGTVVAVHRRATHFVSKETQSAIQLVAGVGVRHDAHAGATVKHRSRVARTPEKPNLRQVLLISTEMHRELERRGFAVGPGAMGENVTTEGLDLHALPTGTRLRLGSDAVIAITGLRNPCRQLDGLQPGLMAALLGRDEAGELIRRAGIMSVVAAAGTVRAGAAIEVVLPPEPWEPLQPV
jgi:MOSC domain-containing protein YiiM